MKSDNPKPLLVVNGHGIFFAILDPDAEVKTPELKQRRCAIFASIKDMYEYVINRSSLSKEEVEGYEIELKKMASEQSGQIVWHHNCRGTWLAIDLTTETIEDYIATYEL